MLQIATIPDGQDAAAPAATRSGLAWLMRRVCADMRAQRYMLAEPTVERGPKSVRIITSNWIFDAIEDLGCEGLARIMESSHAVSLGAPARPLLPATAGFLSPAEKRALDDHDHAEIHCLRIDACGGTAFALFSAEAPRRIDAAALARAHMLCTYAVGQFFKACGERVSPDPLSERERECLVWVSEGKTTDEVALILGVSANTVNSYIAHAIQKFGASNRAMAIATAIRSGII